MANTGLAGAFAVKRPGWSDIGGWASPLQYNGIQLGDIDGDGQAELLGRGSAPPASAIYGGAPAGPGPLSANTFDKTYGQWNAMPDGPVLAVPGLRASLFLTPSGPALGRGASSFLLGDIDADGRAEMIVVWDDFIAVFAYDPSTGAWNPVPDTNLPNGPNLGLMGILELNYLTLALVDIDGDGQQELACLSNSPNGSLQFWHCDKTSHAWTAMPSLDLPSGTDWTISPLEPNTNTPDAYYGCIRYGTLAGRQHVFARASDGVYIYSYSAETSSWSVPAACSIPALSDANGWKQPQYYRTFQVADVDGDGNVEVLARGAGGMQIWFTSASQGTWTEAAGPPLSDANGWAQPEYYLTIQCADVNGDGQAEVLARSSAGLYTFLYDKATGVWSGGPMISSLTDQAGWNQPQYYSTIACADIDGDGQAELIARGADGVQTYKYNAGAWAPASATFPQFTGDELTAYQQISAQLMNGEAGADLRSLYPKAASYNWGEAQSNLILWSQSSQNGAAWQAVAKQLADEVNALQQVITFFGNLNTLLTDEAFAKNLVLLEFANVVSSTFSNPDDSSSVGFSVLSNLINVIWALSGVASDLAGVGVVAGLFESAVGFASTFAGGNSVPTNPITAPFNQMVSDLVNGFSNTLAANNSNEAAVFSDYGLLMTIGGWLEEGAWLVGPNDVTEAITLASRAYAFYVIQTLAPLVWCVYFAGSFSSNPSPPCGYPTDWTKSGQPLIPTAKRIWPYYIASIMRNDDDSDCLSVSTLGNLFNPTADNDPLPLAIPPDDVLNSRNGWKLPVVYDSFNPG